MRSLKVSFVSNSSLKYGSERALLELVDVLRPLGVECSVILPSKGPLSNDLEKRNITYCTLPYKCWADQPPLSIWRRITVSLWNFFVAIRIAMVLSRWKCDVVISNTTFICVGALSAKLLRLPHIWNIHQFGIENLNFVFHLGHNFSLWLIDRLSTICLTCSKTVSQEFQKYIASSKLKVVYQSVTVSQDRIKPFPIDHYSGIRCMMVGRVDKEKRQEDAIRAIAKIINQGIKIKLFIIGGINHNYKEYLSKLILEYNLYDHVEFLGYVENSFPFIQYGDVILSCACFEAGSRVTIEAMKAGKTVIATRHGVHPEFIREGFNGLLYTPMDENELAEKIHYVIMHPKKAREMANNGRKWALQRFNQKSYGEKVLGILKSLIA